MIFRLSCRYKNRHLKTNGLQDQFSASDWPSLVFFFIKLNIWNAIFSSQNVTEIGGYDLSAMLQYQGWVLIVTMLAQSHNQYGSSRRYQVRANHRLSIYPFNFWQFHTASFFGNIIVQLGIVVLTLGLMFT